MKSFFYCHSDDILKYGLVAKNPDDRQLSVAEHVAYGSRDGKSRYISTSSSLDAVQHFRYMKTQERSARSTKNKITIMSSQSVVFIK
jgi:hypothetical protein